MIMKYDVKANTDFNFENCAADYLNELAESNGLIDLPAGNYYIGKKVTFPISKLISMQGNNPVPRANNEDTTFFYTDKDIELFEILGSDMTILNGVIYFGFIPESKNVVGLGIGNSETLVTKNILIDGFSVVGDMRKLQRGEDIGGTGIKFNTDQDSGKSYGISDIRITNSVLDSLGICMHAPKKISSNCWFNNVQYSGRMFRSKQGAIMETGSVMKMNILTQDAPVLWETEQDKYYHIFTPWTEHNIIPYDYTTRERDPQRLYRHGKDRLIYSVDQTNTAMSDSIISLKRQHLLNNNNYTIVKDPIDFAFSGIPNNATPLTNQVALSGLEAGFSYKGYTELEPIELLSLKNLVIEDATTLTFPSKKGGVYDLTFKSFGDKGSQLFKTIGVDEMYTSDVWKERSYEIVANGDVVELNFSRNLGISSIYEGTDIIKWNDTFIRGEIYRITLSDGNESYSVEYLPDPLESTQDDILALRKLFKAVNPKLNVTKAAYGGIGFMVLKTFEGRMVTATTEKISHGSFQIADLKVVEVWHKNNLRPSQLPENPLIKIINNDLLQKTNATDSNGHILNSEMDMAEIVIPVQLAPQKVRRVLIAVGRWLPKKMQMILYNDRKDEINYSVVFENELASNSLLDALPDLTKIKDLQTTHIILRFLGSRDMEKKVGISDVLVTTQYNKFLGLSLDKLIIGGIEIDAETLKKT